MSHFTLIYGCMFSGKTTKLIEKFNESVFSSEEKVAVKPAIDNRYAPAKINAHSGIQMPGHRLHKPEEMTSLVLEHTKELYIDEIQFFNKDLIPTLHYILSLGVKVIGAGLDLDFLGRPFGEMEKLKQLARETIELDAVCAVCQGKAKFTFRKSNASDLLLVGHTDLYESRCKTHWEEGLLEQSQPKP